MSALLSPTCEIGAFEDMRCDWRFDFFFFYFQMWRFITGRGVSSSRTVFLYFFSKGSASEVFFFFDKSKEGKYKFSKWHWSRPFGRLWWVTCNLIWGSLKELWGKSWCDSSTLRISMFPTPSFLRLRSRFQFFLLMVGLLAVLVMIIFLYFCLIFFFFIVILVWFVLVSTKIYVYIYKNTILLAN
jgi:hypothetical protein